jgi:hypothetical protein
MLLYVSRCFKSKHYIKSNGTGGHACIREEEVVGYSKVARPINLSIFHSRTYSLNQSIIQSTKQPICPDVCLNIICHCDHITVYCETHQIHTRACNHAYSTIHSLAFYSSGLLLLLLTLLHTHSSPNNFSFHISDLP